MFELSNNDRIDFLVMNYNNTTHSINEVYKALEEYKTVEKYMCDGRTNGYAPKKTALNAVLKSYWNEFYNSFGFRDFLSSERKNDFDKMMDGELPEYTVDNLKATATTLYTDLEKYFCEKVDSLFKRLSGDHITNKPSGFSERMIYKYVWDSLIECIRSRASDEIHDLRSVIFTILGKPVPSRNDTYNLLRCIMETGEWYDLDGGAYRIKVFKNGNAHFEVHPYIAMKLNEILSRLYPTAIPPKYRTVTKKIKEFEYVQKTLTDNELGFIQDLARGKSAHIYLEDWKKELVYNLGGWLDERPRTQYGRNVGTIYEINFPFFIQPMIREILKRGSIGDYKSYQYYPTPENVVDTVTDFMKDNLTEFETVLEPSGGTGAIVRGIKKNFRDAKIDTFEINPIHATILQTHDINNVINEDFLKVEPKQKYDVVVMNPPYSLNRWSMHLEHATKFSDTIISILPTGHANKIIDMMEKMGYCTSCHGEYDNFDKTNIKVSIYFSRRDQ